MTAQIASTAREAGRVARVAQKISSAWLWTCARPERQFLLFAIAGCIVLLALIPPLAGGNETYNFQRVAGIAAFHPLIEPASVPRGVVRLLDNAHRQFPEGAKPPFRYSGAEFRSLASIPLSDSVHEVLQPNAIAVLNPVGYVPQVTAYWLGYSLGLTPLALFYLGRIAGACAGIVLTFLAIRKMPFGGYALAAIAMLPTIVFSRSTLDADQLTNAVAFYFTASVFAVMVQPGKISARALTVLVLSALVVAQCKSAYLLLPLLALAIPVERFGSRWGWMVASALVILPGIVTSAVWMIALKNSFFAGAQYHTWAGNVYPDRQMAHIIANPLSYVTALLRTMFASNLVPIALLGFIGIFGPPVAMPVIFYAAILGCLLIVLRGESSRPVPAAARWLAPAIFAAGFVLILTLLYVQWDGVDAPVVNGFQGRYLYPLVAPLLVFLPRRKSGPFLGLESKHWAGVLGVFALSGTFLVTWTTYWA